MNTMAAALKDAMQKAQGRGLPAVGSAWLVPHRTGYAVGVVIEARRDVVLRMEDGSRVGCDAARWAGKVRGGEVWPAEQGATPEARKVTGWELLQGVAG